MKILLVDDCAMMRRFERKVLGDLPYVEFVEAIDGVEALVAANVQGPFDLMLVDWKMPRMDGLAFLKLLRTTDRSTRVIIVTSESGKANVMEAMRVGVNGFVVKPFQPATLLAKVRQAIESAAA